MKFEVTLPNGDSAGGDTLESAAIAAATLVEDASRYLRENLTVTKDGVFDPSLTQMLQQAGMVA